MVTALVLKTALVPAHFWLPSAHSAAPTPVSATLSALVVKGSFFVLLRLFVDVMPPDYLNGAGIVLGLLGAIAIAWGSILAAMQTRLKMLVAYSTVAQIGYLFLVFPIIRTGGPALATALAGILVHVLAHGIAKSAMFLTAGGFLSRYRTDNIDKLAGAARATPVLAFSFALAGVTMMGLPPSGGFGAKWLIVSAYLQAGQWWWAAVPVVGGLLAAIYIFRVVRITLADADPEVFASQAPGRVEWLPFGLAALSVMLVLAVPFVIRLLEVTSVAATGAVSGL
jgi:formate hydrogenlyase subunit 3/multisubunit Na+/H+ antiporter MnhD subunit